ncbi:MAG: riboflavin biosynthesis protein RibF [Akkermansiaceae bacterium]|nr:riboflavin biosynthesis protein RibF [Akkermansiaceae bacterium]
MRPFIGVVQVFHKLKELSDSGLSFGLALGIFDGVHLGHQAVLDAARGFKKLGVLTFEPHPVQVLAPDRAPRRILANLEHKKRILASLGVDFVVVVNFTREFAGKDAREFASELFATSVKRLSAGEDWSFGRCREGNMNRLAEWGSGVGVEVSAVRAVKLDGERISSTRIRQCLRDENLAGAVAMLGRPYSVFGEVIKGRQLGRTIGFPTANVAVLEEQVPPNGVYLIEGNGIRGVANIGTRPTVDESARRSLEVHLFSENIPMEYGWELEVSFLKKIREEVKFGSVDELKAQISRDVETAKAH